MTPQQKADHPRIPTRPICHRCRRYITIDTDADDDLWLEVIGPLHGPGYICADCFTRAADERLIRWEGKLRLVPISLAAQADIQARVEAGDFTTPPPAPAAGQGKCDLGVGCDETGVCYALANGHPEQCGRGFQPEAHGADAVVRDMRLYAKTHTVGVGFVADWADKLDTMISALPGDGVAQGGGCPACNVRIDGVSVCSEHQATTEQPAPAAGEVSEDTKRLDFIETNRVAITPEYEGPWDAELYGDESSRKYQYSGRTPREAIDKVILATTPPASTQEEL